MGIEENFLKKKFVANMKVLATLLSAGAQANPLNTYLNSWVDSYIAIGEWILSPEGSSFGPALANIDQEFVSEKWEYCNANGDGIITRAEQQACDRKLAEIWGWEEQSAVIEKRLLESEVFQKLGKLNPSGNLGRNQYTGTVGFQIFAEVHHGWFKYDK